MIKVFEAFDLMEAGRVRSLLEAHGIRTFLKNEFAAGGLGELPFKGLAPQVFILDEDDLARAIELLREDGTAE